MNYVGLEFITRRVTPEEEQSNIPIKGLYTENITDWPISIQGIRIKGLSSPKTMPMREFLDQIKKPDKTEQKRPTYTYNIYPQYSTILDGRLFRMDFAIIVEKQLTNEITKEVFCIECDGHEWHKSKDQRAYDNDRMRIFLKHGIKTLRYTGTQITNFDQDKVIDFDTTIMKNLSGTDSLIYILRYF